MDLSVMQRAEVDDEKRAGGIVVMRVDFGLFTDFTRLFLDVIVPDSPPGFKASGIFLDVSLHACHDLIHVVPFVPPLPTTLGVTRIAEIQITTRGGGQVLREVFRLSALLTVGDIGFDEVGEVHMEV